MFGSIPCRQKLIYSPDTDVYNICLTRFISVETYLGREGEVRFNAAILFAVSEVSPGTRPCTICRSEFNLPKQVSCAIAVGSGLVCPVCSTHSGEIQNGLIRKILEINVEIAANEEEILACRCPTCYKDDESCAKCRKLNLKIKSKWIGGDDDDGRTPQQKQNAAERLSRTDVDSTSEC